MLPNCISQKVGSLKTPYKEIQSLAISVRVLSKADHKSTLTKARSHRRGCKTFPAAFDLFVNSVNDIEHQCNHQVVILLSHISIIRSHVVRYENHTLKIRRYISETNSFIGSRTKSLIE